MSYSAHQKISSDYYFNDLFHTTNIIICIDYHFSAEMTKLEEFLRIINHLKEGIRQQKHQTHYHDDYQ
jgi:hypothetical protein